MTKYDLTDLRLFIAVAEKRNLTKGAQDIFLAPSSASHRLKLLEENIGAQLMVREARGMSLTKAGEILLRHAKKVLATLEQMQSDISPYTHGNQAHVKIWANTNAIHTYLPDDLGAFLEINPDVSVTLEEHSSEKIALAVANGDIELGVVAEYDKSADVQLYPYKQDRLVLVVPIDHNLATKKSITFEEVVNYPFVILNEGSAIHTFTMNKAALLGKHLNIRAQVKSFDAVCRMVNSGVGVAVVPYDSVAYQSSLKLTTVELEEPWAKRNLMVCVKKNSEIGTLSQQLLNHLTLSSSSQPKA